MRLPPGSRRRGVHHVGRVLPDDRMTLGEPPTSAQERRVGLPGGGRNVTDVPLRSEACASQCSAAHQRSAEGGPHWRPIASTRHRSCLEEAGRPHLCRQRICSRAVAVDGPGNPACRSVHRPHTRMRRSPFWDGVARRCTWDAWSLWACRRGRPEHHVHASS